MPDDDITIEVNGRGADQAAVSLLDHEGWGHFTAMQVRAGRRVVWICTCRGWRRPTGRCTGGRWAGRRSAPASGML